MSSQAGYVRTCDRGFRPVGRRALRLFACHEIKSSIPLINPEGRYPHGSGMQDNFMQIPGRRKATQRE